jgi:hypothetical protein
VKDYPPAFIATERDRFFRTERAMLVWNELDADTYQRLHRATLHQCTRRKKHMGEMAKDPVESPVLLQGKRWNVNVMYPRYVLDQKEASKTYLDGDELDRTVL